MRIIFMGTPEFAVPSLDRLVKAGYDIPYVVTVPDKPAGRGQQLRPSPIKIYAEANQIPVLQPEKLRDASFVATLEAIKPDLMVVVAFRMLPEVIWKMPRLGTFNLHSSLLPQYRGAAPINWAVINGEKNSGVTTFLIDEKIDTGNILLQHKTDIPDEWTAGELHDCLMETGADLVLDTVRGLESGSLHAVPQIHSLAVHHAPKIFKEDCKINWGQPAQKVRNLIRGLSPYPAAWTTLQGKQLKIFFARLTGQFTDQPPGTISSDKKTLLFACQDQWLEITDLQLEGKKRMKTEDFLRGFQL
ncbi:MAG: methionyl-tRNA formyltransferase [Bacteroidia bacterium]|nr:methionyl-tRNA formyltransferase [Bacteroidia bacterium]